DYYYKIVHCTRDWKVSNLKVTEYLNGTQNTRISTYETSFNTFQAFVHYKVSFPNREAQILISGNYILEIYNEDGEKVLARKFVLYENLAQVGVEVKKTRNLEVAPYKQNVYLNIDFGNELLQNPQKNVNVVILQNGQWYNALTDLKPQYILGNQFKYQYDEETNFWAGNEFLYFDTSDIRQINNTVSKITRNELYQVYLYPRAPLGKNNLYSFYQDVNGAFKPRNKFRDNPNTEADYTWVYFTYNLEKLPSSQKLYVVGMFNDYQLSSDFELTFDEASNTYKTELFIKQGFTNYKYVIVDAKGKVLEELNPDGNFYETENVYHALVYYKTDSDRYERVIGLGNADSKLITN
ncbi:MAG TPA: type IX secretion system plug protein domain-containing protein, partial [Flavobacterium sp.]|nr:type IX secretion system plug protein domain-containing protein [Flavobacterium sp.]